MYIQNKQIKKLTCIYLYIKIVILFEGCFYLIWQRSYIKVKLHRRIFSRKGPLLENYR